MGALESAAEAELASLENGAKLALEAVQLHVDAVQVRQHPQHSGDSSSFRLFWHLFGREVRSLNTLGLHFDHAKSNICQNY